MLVRTPCTDHANKACWVACSEEDFKAAVRIRDHPWMQLYQRIQQARAARYDEVRVLGSM